MVMGSGRGAHCGAIVGSGQSGSGGARGDLHDVGRRVLAAIDSSLSAGSLADLPEEPCVLIASDLSPSDTATLDTSRVAGLATALGGPTSHSAILARTLGLPSIVAGGADLLSLEPGATVIVDGDSGRVWLDPSPQDLIGTSLDG
jgi:phosphocarrier protein FPr